MADKKTTKKEETKKDKPKKSESPTGSNEPTKKEVKAFNLRDVPTKDLAKLVNVQPQHKYTATGEINRVSVLDAIKAKYKGDEKSLIKDLD